jgi:NAD(P)-dependent dehydrogenase (short-subunit alcohol dehydrogenase family)
LIATALDGFEGIDILVNNAGIMRWAQFPEIEPADLDRHLAVHVGGSFHTTRAAWPHMVRQEYGRIVMTTSAGLFGLPNNTSYATAKGGVIGLTHSLRTAGTHNIRSTSSPGGVTRMAGKRADGDMGMPRVGRRWCVPRHEDCR